MEESSGSSRSSRAAPMDSLHRLLSASPLTYLEGDNQPVNMDRVYIVSSLVVCVVPGILSCLPILFKVAAAFMINDGHPPSALSLKYCSRHGRLMLMRLVVRPSELLLPLSRILALLSTSRQEVSQFSLQLTRTIVRAFYLVTCEEQTGNNLGLPRSSSLSINFGTDVRGSEKRDDH